MTNCYYQWLFVKKPVSGDLFLSLSLSPELSSFQFAFSTKAKFKTKLSLDIELKKKKKKLRSVQNIQFKSTYLNNIIYIIEANANTFH